MKVGPCVEQATEDNVLDSSLQNQYAIQHSQVLYSQFRATKVDVL